MNRFCTVDAYRNNSQISWIVCVLFIFLSSDMRGTEIAFVREPSKITLAVDSLVMRTRGHVRVKPIHACKIAKTRDAFLTADGLADAISNKVIAVLDETGSIEQRISQIEPIIQETANARMANLQTTDHKMFDRFLKRQWPVIYIVVFGVKDDVSFVYERGFWCDEKATNKCSVVVAERRSCPGTCAQQSYIPYIPPTTDIRAFLAAHPQLVHGTPAADLARTLVEVQRDASPDEVGGPITVLTVTPRGLAWTNDDVGCQQQWNQKSKPNTEGPFSLPDRE